jgi:hypothetical protein
MRTSFIAYGANIEAEIHRDGDECTARMLSI